MRSDMTPRQWEREKEDAANLVSFWRGQTRQAIRAYNAAFIQASTQKRADMLASVSRAIRQYRRAQAKFRHLRTAPAFRFYSLMTEVRYAA